MERWTPNLSGLQVLTCPTCHGFGFELTSGRKHVQCPKCHLVDAVVGVMPDQVLFFSRRINRVSTHARRFLNWFNRALDVGCLLAALVSVGLAGWNILQTVDHGSSLSQVFTTPHPAVAGIWLGMVLVLFLIYRITHASELTRYLSPFSLLSNQKPLLSGLNQWSAAHQVKGKAKVNLSLYLNEDGLRALEDAVLLAQQLHHTSVTPIHVFASALKAKQSSVVMGRLGLDQTRLMKKLASALHRLDEPQPVGLRPQVKPKVELELAEHTRQAVILAGYFARLAARPRIEATQLIQATVTSDQNLQDVFADLDVDLKSVFNTVEWIHIQQNLRDRYSRWRSTRLNKPKGSMNRSMTARPTPTLDSIGQDYTQYARAGRFGYRIGREQELQEAFRILKEGTGNVLFVGEPGGGKSTLLEGIADLMTSEDVPKNLQDKRFVVIDPGSLVAGSAGLGTLEARMQTLIREIIKAGNVLLGIEDIHHLLGASSVGGSEDVGHLFMNYLSQGYLHVIATTTTAEFQKYIQPQETFLRRFQIVKVGELPPADALRVLMGRSGSVEYKAKVFFSYAALAACVDLSDRYIKDRYLPAKALDIMEESALLAAEQRGQNTIVTKEDVGAVISEKTNVPVANVGEGEADKLLHLEELLHERIVGQDDAVKAIGSAMRRSREDLRDLKRPIASFLFLGPTGVGKTETAKALAQVYFGSEQQMIRVDMSEYQDQFSLYKLIGASGEAGNLTEAVRQKPFGVVLFDEVEKAHPDVLNILLQILDDGRLTEGTGKTIDFTNTIIIATSNAASQQIQAGFAAGQSLEELKRQLLEQDLLKYFRPELLNRFDHVTVFTPLSFNEIIQVTTLLLAGVAKQVAAKGITLQISEPAVQELATKGYDPKFGARPLRRLIQDTVNDGLAKLLLEHKLGSRDVVVLQPGGLMTIQKAEIL